MKGVLFLKKSDSNDIINYIIHMNNNFEKSRESYESRINYVENKLDKIKLKNKDYNVEDYIKSKSKLKINNFINKISNNLKFELTNLSKNNFDIYKEDFKFLIQDFTTSLMRFDFESDIIILKNIPNAFNILIQELENNPIFQKIDYLFKDYYPQEFSYYDLKGNKKILKDYKKLNSIKNYINLKKEVSKLSEKYIKYINK